MTSSWFVPLLCRGTTEAALNGKRLLHPSPLTQQMGGTQNMEGCTSEVVAVKPLINTEFTTSLAALLPVENTGLRLTEHIFVYFCGYTK